MTPNEAFIKVQNTLLEKVVCMGGRDYDTEYVFFVAAPGSDQEKCLFVGGNQWSVNKSTERVRKIDLTELRDKHWKPIEVD